MERIQKNFGFGCMRLPMVGDVVDEAEFCRMVDLFLERGFNYFDTAHGYLDGKSELAIKAGLTSRYPRERYILTDKLTNAFFKSEAEIRPFFASQLEACGVDYFDFYLMHAQNARIFDYFKQHRAYETAFALKNEGKIRHVGISFHDKASVLEQILTEYPEIEVVQLQFNYADYDAPSVEGRLCYEVCRKHNKPVIVMEPVKGGKLAALPEEANAVFAALGSKSPASYAIRFAAGFDGIMMVLSGMSNLAQMEDNLSFMEHFEPLNEVEQAAIAKVQDIFHKMHQIECTECRYCVSGCPQQILIPQLFTAHNLFAAFNDWNSQSYYEQSTKQNGKASDCIECGACEAACPQQLPIRDLLKKVSKVFDKTED